MLAHRQTAKMEDHTASAVRKCLLNTLATTPISGGRSFIRSLRTRQAIGDRGPVYKAFQVTKNIQDETQQHARSHAMRFHFIFPRHINT